MAMERCAKCGVYSTPWQFVEELCGHICYDCYMDLKDNLSECDSEC